MQEFQFVITEACYTQIAKGNNTVLMGEKNCYNRNKQMYHKDYIQDAKYRKTQIIVVFFKTNEVTDFISFIS